MNRNISAVCLLVGVVGCSSPAPPEPTRREEPPPPGSPLLPPPGAPGIPKAASPVPTPAPSVVGMWKGVQNNPELIDFRADRTLSVTNPAAPGPITGIYSHNHPNLKLVINLTGRQHELNYVVAACTDSLLILRSPLPNPYTGKTVNVLRRVVPGRPEPAPHAVAEYRTRLLGTWQHDKSDEGLQFLAGGEFVGLKAKARNYSGLYTLDGDALQLSASMPTGIRKAEFTVVDLTDTELHLLSAKNDYLVYRRQ